MRTAARLLSEKSVALTLVMVLAVLVVSVVSAAALRAPAPVVAYALTSLVLVIATAGYFHSKGRLLVPAFPLLLPAATQLAGVGRWNKCIVLGAAIALSGWFGAYVSIIWRWSP